jgi:hypothetical protein
VAPGQANACLSQAITQPGAALRGAGQGEKMKYVKMLALAAVAAGALMAFVGAGTASAGVLCSTTTGTKPCPAGQRWPNKTPIVMSIPSGSKAVLVDTTGEELDSCTGSEVSGEITNEGSETEEVEGSVSSLTWSSCTFPTTTLETGPIKVDKIAGSSNGTVTAVKQFRVTINTIFFGSCIYGVTAGTSIGDLTEGNPGIFHAKAVAEKFSGSSLACPSTSNWTGTYTVTKPANTTLSVSPS